MSTSADAFDSHMPVWLKEQSQPWQKLKYQLVHSNLAKHIDFKRTLRVLDAGGGNGFDSLPLAQRGHTVEIVDYSAAMLAEAERGAASLGVQDRLGTHHADLAAIATLFPSPQFDLVLCHNVLQYVDDVPTLLQTLCRTLWPGGVLSVLSINRYSIPYYQAFTHGDLAEAFNQVDARCVTTVVFETALTAYASDEIAPMLRQAGCDVIGDYGVRCMFDYWGNNDLKSEPAVFAELERLEYALSDRHPHKLLARYFQLIGRKSS